MDGTEKLILILGLIFIFTACWCFKEWLDYKTFVKKLEIETKIKAEETKCYQIMKELAEEVLSKLN